MVPCQKCQEGKARAYVGGQRLGQQLDEISTSWNRELVEQLESRSLVKLLSATSMFAIEARVSIQRVSECASHMAEIRVEG